MAALRRGLAVVAIAAVVTLTAGCFRTTVDTRALDELYAEIPDDKPGCAAAVYDDDAIVWTGVRGFADVEARLLITDDTVFGIGPTTQQFTATAVLLLIERGAIGLDDSVRRYLPTLPPWADAITVKHLLQRTSGIPDIGRLDLALTAEGLTADDVLAAVARVEKPNFPAGTRYWTSWTESVLQGLLVEAVDGRPLPRFLEDEVFRPTGMHAVMDLTPEIPGVAKSYSSANSGPVTGPWWDWVGDSGIFTTASDLARWGREYWDPKVGGEEVRRLRTSFMVLASLGAAVTGERLPEPGEARYGAGVVAVREDEGPYFLRAVSGFDLGFISDLVVFPEERLAAAVLCNHAGHDPSDTAKALLDAYVESRS